MCIVKNMLFTKPQREKFGKLLREHRVASGMSQLQVARKAFHYQVSHCKVSRIERHVMRNVDAYAVERIASVLGIPRVALEAIDPKFSARAAVTRTANAQGLWNHPAALA